MMAKVDEDGSGDIDFNEFIMLMQDKEFEHVFLPLLRAKSNARQDRGSADLFLQSVYSTALATPVKEVDDDETPGTKRTVQA